MRGLCHLVVVLLLAGCAQQGPERVVEPRPDAGPAARGTALLRQAMIAGHARVRADAGVAPLVWDDALAGAARAYAQEMAATGRFAHAPQPAGGPARQGENLWTGTRGAYGYDEMVGHWAAERQAFVNAPVPQSSRTGRFEDVGHYSQMMWRDSTRFGCAMASNARDDFLACRYAPAGNVFGKRAY